MIHQDPHHVSCGQHSSSTGVHGYNESMRPAVRQFHPPSNLPIWAVIVLGLIVFVSAGFFAGINLMIGGAPSSPCTKATTVCGPGSSVFLARAGTGALIALLGLGLLACGSVLLNRRRQLRFNPAPGWPPVASWWRPPRDWQPPVEWCRAPKDWPWWIKHGD